MEIDTKILIYRNLFKQSGLDPVAFYQDNLARATKSLSRSEKKLGKKRMVILPYNEFLDTICRYKAGENRKGFSDEGVFLFVEERDFVLITASWFLLGKRIIEMWNDEEITPRIHEFYEKWSEVGHEINAEHKLGTAIARISISSLPKEHAIVGKISIGEIIDFATSEDYWNGVSTEIHISIMEKDRVKYSKIEVYSPMDVLLDPSAFISTSYTGIAIRKNGEVAVKEKFFYNGHQSSSEEEVWNRLNCKLMNIRKILALSQELRKTDKLKDMVLDTLDRLG